jgi:uncharacterized protein (DUF952 family)
VTESASTYDPGVIYHIIDTSEWESHAGSDRFGSASLETEGFVHCCEHHQLHAVARAWFAGQERLVVVEIDPERVDVPVVWEDSYGVGESFPHVYGTIPMGAVVSVGRLPDEELPQPPWSSRT